VCLLVASACQGADREGGETGNPDAGPERAAPEPPAAEVRIVSLIPSLSEIVVALGAADQLVARTDYDTDPLLVDLPSVGGGLDPNLEALVGLGAELVLMPGVRETPGLVERLADFGIEGWVLETETVDDLLEAVTEIGSRLDRRGPADSLRSAIQAGLDEVRTRVEGRPPVSVMYVVWGDPPMTAGARTFVDEVIRIAGGRNVFDDSPIQWPTVGFEAIVDRAPDMIIWPRGEVGSADLDQIAQRPGWRDVAAVQARRVIFVDADLFNRPGPGVVEAARELARRLHPDAF
jgi:iron complex transport system substrate-binding protein